MSGIQHDMQVLGLSIGRGQDAQLDVVEIDGSDAPIAIRDIALWKDVQPDCATIDIRPATAWIKPDRVRLI